MYSNSKQTESVPPFASVHGYATEVVDAAIEWTKWTTRNTNVDFENHPEAARQLLRPHKGKFEGPLIETSARILAAEVSRLRSDRDRLLAAIDDAICWANGRQYEWGERAENAFAFIERASAESHNEKLNDGAKPGKVGHE